MEIVQVNSIKAWLLAARPKTLANISILKNGKAKAIKVDTLNKICRALDCQPGDILEYVPSDDEI